MLETFQESLGTLKRSCTKDLQKAHRTQFKKISGHRVTGCLTQTKNKSGLIILGVCVNSFLQAPHRKELEQELLQSHTAVNQRAAELYDKETLTSQSSWSSTK